MYVTATNKEFILQTDTGKIITQTYSLGLFKPRIYGFADLIADTGAAPEYFTNVIRLQDTRLGKDERNTIEAVDYQTGQLLWSLDQVVSNIAVDQTRIYVLTEQGHLLGLNPRSGQPLSFVEFDPLEYRRNETSYGVAVDKEVGLIYVYLGDSKQLFAFREVR